MGQCLGAYYYIVLVRSEGHRPSIAKTPFPAPCLVAGVLAYYIIKGVLLFDYDKFLFWCEKYNISTIKFDKNQLNLRRFGNYFEDMYRNRRLTKSIGDMEVKYNKLRGPYKNPNKAVINVTTRMTICEDKI